MWGVEGTDDHDFTERQDIWKSRVQEKSNRSWSEAETFQSKSRGRFTVLFRMIGQEQELA